MAHQIVYGVSRHISVTIAVVLYGLILAVPTRRALPQERAAPPSLPLVAAARESLARGDTTTALALLNQATDAAPRDPEALYWRGMLLVRALRLGLGDVPEQILAWRLLDRGASISPRDARFPLELGRLRLKNPLLRVDAERLLRRSYTIAQANAQGAVGAEAAWELGAIRERRYRTAWHRRVYTSAIFFDQFAARTRLHYVREFLEHQSRAVENAGVVERTEAEDWYRRGLAVDSLSSVNLVGLLGLLYDEGRHDEMLSLSSVQRAQGTTNATVWMAAGLAAWRRGNGARADSLFADGLGRLSPPERASIEHIGHLLTKADSVNLSRLDSTSFAATSRTFWEASNPLTALPYNAARVEYLARVAVATLRYGDAETGARGWRSDRGQVVLRYGEPPVTALFPVTDNPDARDAAGRIVSVFFYPTTELAFVFSGAAAMNLASFAGDFRDFADAARDDAPFRLDNLPLAARVDTLELQVSRFMARTPAEYDVVVAGYLNPERWYKGVDLDSGTVQMTLYRGRPDRLQPIDTQTVRVGTGSSSARTWISTPRLPLGDYRLRLEAYDPEVQSAAARAHVVLPLTVNPSALSLSDLMIGNGGREDGVLQDWRSSGVTPSGRNVVYPLDTFALYWESYGLQPSTVDAFRVNVRITVRLLEIERKGDAVSRWLANLADKLALTPEGEDRLSLSFPRGEARAGRDRLPLVVRLSLGDAPLGRYRLEVEMTDSVSGRAATSMREFHVRRRPVVSP